MGWNYCFALWALGAVLMAYIVRKASAESDDEFPVVVEAVAVTLWPIVVFYIVARELMDRVDSDDEDEDDEDDDDIEPDDNDAMRA